MSEHLPQSLHSEMASMFAVVIDRREAAERLSCKADQWHGTCEALSDTANHEAKIAIALEIAGEPDKLFSVSLLQEAIVESLGHDSECTPDPSATFNYCIDCLQPAGFVTEEKVQRRGYNVPWLVTAYRLNQDAPQELLAGIGLVGDWSLRWPDIPVQSILGASSSKGATKAAEARINIFMELLTSPNSAIAVSDMDGLSNVAFHTVDKTLEELEVLGLVSREGVKSNNDRKHVVTNNQYSGTRPFDSLQLDTKLVYEFLSQRYAGDVFTQQELLGYVTTGVKIDPSYDVVAVRKNLATSLSAAKKNIRFPGIKQAQRYNGNATHTRILLNPNFIEPISELMQIIVDINDRNPTQIVRGLQLAAQIKNSDSGIKDLMTKASRFSAHSQSKGTAANEKAVEDVVMESEIPLSVKDVLSRLEDRSLKLGKRVVETCLRKLRESQKLEADLVQPDPTSKRQSLVYHRPAQADHEATALAA